MLYRALMGTALVLVVGVWGYHATQERTGLPQRPTDAPERWSGGTLSQQSTPAIDTYGEAEVSTTTMDEGLLPVRKKEDPLAGPPTVDNGEPGTPQGPPTPAPDQAWSKVEAVLESAGEEHWANLMTSEKAEVCTALTQNTPAGFSPLSVSEVTELWNKQAAYEALVSGNPDMSSEEKAELKAEIILGGGQ